MMTLLLVGLLTLPITLTASTDGEGKADASPANKHDGKVIHITTEQFKELIWDYEKNPDQWVYKGDLPCMVDFYADWCRPCKIIAPIMDELAEEYKGEIYIYKVDTDKEKEIASIFNIRSIPSLLMIPMEGKPQMATGALPKPTFVEIIDKVLLGNE
ncbi:MAG: thioredoxin [Bacteroidia bacterium]|nr:thioredoxin [Bacteroidia bacterium]